MHLYFDSYLWTFLPAIILLTLSPGVDTLLVMRNTARGGHRDGLLTSIAICSALFMHAAVSAGGISLILLQSAWLFSLLKIAGAVYLVWLGIGSLRSALQRRQGLPVQAAATGTRRVPAWQSLREGFLSNALNPKTVVFYMAFLPQFIQPGDPALAKSLFLAGIHFVIANLWQALLVLMVARAGLWLTRPGVSRGFNGLAGTVMVFFGLRLALER